MSYRTGAELTEDARREIAEIQPPAVRKLLDDGDDAIFLDVREPNEWNMGRIPGAVHLPRGQIESKIETMIQRGRRVVVYCAKGNRSALAALTLKQMGYSEVESMAKGFEGWVGIDGPVED